MKSFISFKNSISLFKSHYSSFCTKINLTLHFTNKNNKQVIEAEVGKTLLDAFLENKLQNVGVCGGKCLCGTCHCILPQELYDESGEKGYEEEDLLSIALGCEETSRCGCQVKITENFNGKTIKMPPLSTSELEEGTN